MKASPETKLRAKTSMLSVFGIARGYNVNTDLIYRKTRQYTKLSHARLNSLNNILSGHI